jgi:hypothetical protein
MSDTLITHFLEWLTVDADLTCEARGGRTRLFVGGSPATRSDVGRWALQWLAFTHRIPTADLLEELVAGAFAKLEREGSFPKNRSGCGPAGYPLSSR